MMAIVVIAAAPAAAQVNTFLERIYAGYAGPGGRGVSLSHPAALFEPGLAAAMTHGRPDFDPFCAGQDWTPFLAHIGPIGVSADGARANAVVHFANGRPVTLRYTLVRTPLGWRIYDISGGGVASLRALVMRPHPRRTGDDAVD